ncbi:MAG: hypothetical protein IPI85_17295 [Dehalococcoidia bacterium]|nr:hypothetical protein [Dehalococcoidia bacterium]
MPCLDFFAMPARTSASLLCRLAMAPPRRARGFNSYYPMPFRRFGPPSW